MALSFPPLPRCVVCEFALLTLVCFAKDVRIPTSAVLADRLELRISFLFFEVLSSINRRTESAHITNAAIDPSTALVDKPDGANPPRY